MPRILAPFPTRAQQRKGKPLPDGKLKFGEMADNACAQYDVHWPQYVAIDTETTGVGYYDRAFCATVTWRAPVDHGGELCSWYFELDDPRGHEFLRGLVSDVARRGHMVFHNARFDIQKLILAGVLERGTLDHSRIHDTEAQAHLLDPLQPKGLKALARKYLNEDTNEDAVLRKVRSSLGLKKEDGFDPIPRPVLMRYALKDSEFTLRLYEVLWPLLVDAGDGLPELYAHEQELMLVLLDMEAKGMRVDLAYLDATITEYREKVRTGEERLAVIVGAPIGEEEDQFNPASNQQLAAYLVARGHELPLTEKGQPKVDKTSLLATGDELATTILDLRSDQKTLNTYLLAIKREQRCAPGAQYGLIHAGLRQHGASTGRFSSGAASNN